MNGHVQEGHGPGAGPMRPTCDAFELTSVSPPMPGDDSVEARAERKIGYHFRDRRLLSLALVHASIAGTRLESNERLEFLGDAILGMVICDHLFRTYPEALEGELTKIKSNVVSRRSCAEVALELGLDADLILGKGMGGRENLPASLAAAAFESVIGAIYLDGGLECARAFVLQHLAGRVDRAARLGHQHNFKSVLQQALQRCASSNPAYIVLDERGPDHAKCFHVCVEAQGKRFPGCWGTSKKQAEQQAALTALLELGFATMCEDGDIVVRRVEQGEAWPADDANMLDVGGTGPSATSEGHLGDRDVAQGPPLRPPEAA